MNPYQGTEGPEADENVPGASSGHHRLSASEIGEAKNSLAPNSKMIHTQETLIIGKLRQFENSNYWLTRGMTRSSPLFG